MTICGIACAPDYALAWADSAVSRGGVIADSANKLVLNPFAGIIATGSGPSSLLKEADRLTGSAPSLAEILDELPSLMRDRARMKDAVAYGFAGFDPELGRMMVYGLISPFFRPVPTTLFVAPEIEAPRPSSVLDALDIAILQHRAMPHCSGGILSVAELGPDGVRARTLFDLDTMEFVDGVHARPLGTRGASAECAGAGG